MSMIMMDKKKTIDQILGPQKVPEQSKEMDSLHALAEEIISSVSTNDVEGLVSSLKAFFAECYAQPHVEGEHEGE